VVPWVNPVYPPIGILNSSAVFVGLTNVTNRQTHRQTTLLFVDGRTDGRAGGHLRPTLLGRLGGVDLKITVEYKNMPEGLQRSKRSLNWPSIWLC